MDLDTIKRHNNGWWLKYLEQTTIFDTKGIEEQFNWLIKRAEQAEKYELALKEIANLGEEDPARRIGLFARRVLND